MGSERRPLTREEITSGELYGQRRAARVVGAIESRVLHMRIETRRAVEAYLLDASTAYERRVERGYLASVLTRVRSDEQVTADDLQRFAAQWQHLVPRDPELAPAIRRILEERYAISPSRTPTVMRVLGADGVHAGEPVPAPGRETGERSAVDQAELEGEWLRLESGEALFRLGDTSDALFLVISGRLRAVGLNGEVLAEYGRGEAVGAIGALTGEPRTADIVAARDSEVLRLPQETILRVSQSDPRVMLNVTRALARQMRETFSNRRPRYGALTLAFLPGHRGAPMHVVDDLSAALSGLGSTARVNRRALESSLSISGGQDEEALEAETLAWLSSMESREEYIVFEADQDLASRWSQRCVRQADRIVVVAGAGVSATDAASFTLPHLGGRECDLLLVHSQETARPEHTAIWQQALRPALVYHWKPGAPDRTAHVARRLTGRGIGLVLSGGSARGYAHVGVLHAIEEAGLPIDVIGATSMGATIGAGFALGRDSADMRRRVLQTAGRRHLLDPTLPVVALTSGRKVTKLLRRESDDVTIEDLWRPFFCISTNLSVAEPYLHATGPLWQALRASTAIPGIYPPVAGPDGALLVDGGLTNNFPIDVMRAREDVGTVIGVNVAPRREREARYDFGPQVSGWGALMRQLWRFSRRPGVPGALNTILRSNEVQGAALARSTSLTAQADLIIQPAVEQYSMFQFSECGALIDCGYEAGTAAIREWLDGPGREVAAELKFESPGEHSS